MKTKRIARPVSLAVIPLFIHLMIRFSIFFECVLLVRLLGNHAPLQLIVGGMIFITPQLLFLAFVFSVILTTLCVFAVRFIVRPRLLRWRQPKVDDSSSAFHLEAREILEIDIPARSKDGRMWRAGRLVRTNRRIMFLPASWDSEPWIINREQADGGKVVNSPNLFWNTVRNIPPHLEITPVGEPPRSFVVPNPSDWVPAEAANAVNSSVSALPLPLEQRVS